MATLQIPTSPTKALYSMAVDLDGATYLFDFQFNSREGAWYFDLLDAAGGPIRTGIKVATGMSLLRLVKRAVRPPGALVVVDPTGRDREAGRGDLGTEVVIAYVEEADLP